MNRDVADIWLNCCHSVNTRFYYETINNDYTACLSPSPNPPSFFLSRAGFVIHCVRIFPVTKHGRVSIVIEAVVYLKDSIEEPFS